MLAIEAWSGVKAHKPGHYVVVRSRLGGNKLGTITTRPGLTLCQVVIDLQRQAAKLFNHPKFSRRCLQLYWRDLRITPHVDASIPWKMSKHTRDFLTNYLYTSGVEVSALWKPFFPSKTTMRLVSLLSGHQVGQVRLPCSSAKKVLRVLMRKVHNLDMACSATKVGIWAGQADLAQLYYCNQASTNQNNNLSKQARRTLWHVLSNYTCLKVEMVY
jgi:hypothetical protein